MRIKYEKMFQELKNILINKGFSESDADKSAKLFTENSLDGVYSHGINRFPRTIKQIEKGYIDVKAKPIKIDSHGALKRWDGNLGMGNLNATFSMDRAVEIAKEAGIGLVALRNTNHWMRGGTYGWQAANKGCIGICWTNTRANMPAWGGTDNKIGNNPFVMGIPRSNGKHVVLDMAMSQFSNGKIEEYKFEGRKLPVPGGFDTEGNMSQNPKEIEAAKRILPMGFWKGSGFSMVLDIIGAILSGGKATNQIPIKVIKERGITQIFIGIDPGKFNSIAITDDIINGIISNVKTSETVSADEEILYPGERAFRTREENLKQEYQ